MSKIKSFFKDESGQGMTEYALIIALVAILLVATLGLFKDALVNEFTTITNAL